MRNQVLSIDLGSAYTKIAFRNGSDADSVLVHDIPLAPRDLTFCVPSVVANVRRDSKDNWIIGSPAASQLPGPAVRIYRNWKAALFREESTAGPRDEKSTEVPEISQSDATAVALHFFSAIRRMLQDMRFEIDITTLPVRVCIPKFSNFEASEQRITDVLKQADLTPSTSRPALGEPEANALGILSRGWNKTHIPRGVDFQPQPSRSPNLPAMLKVPGLLQALHEVSGYYGVLVIDIGAFTTDFGYVRFDTSRATELNKPTIVQISHPIGIRDLDWAVFNKLPDEAQHAIRKNVSTSEWESIKPALYNGGEAAVRNPRGGVVYLGRGREKKTIQDEVTAFAERIWNLRSRFCETETNTSGVIHAQALTGGGSMIPTVRDALTNRVQVTKGIPLRDLLIELPASATVQGGAGMPNSRQIEAYKRETQELVRGGSAIGGASVFFEEFEAVRRR